MTQDTWNFIFIGLSFALYIGIAIRQRAGSTKEYYTAGGGVSPFANGMATAADWMSAATFISMAGLLATSSDEWSVKQVTTINPGEDPHSSVFFAARSLRNSLGEVPATTSPKRRPTSSMRDLSKR